MNGWKEILGLLGDTGKLMASWKLHSGVKFFMFIPARNQQGIETINVESDVHFNEISSLEIAHIEKLGGHTVINDVEMCRSLLSTVSWVKVESTSEGIRVEMT